MISLFEEILEKLRKMASNSYDMNNRQAYLPSLGPMFHTVYEEVDSLKKEIEDLKSKIEDLQSRMHQ